MNQDILAVDVVHMNVYDFLQDNETEIDLLQRANDAKQKDIETWKGYCEKYCTPEVEASDPYKVTQFENYLKQAQATKYQIMTWDEFEKAQRDFYVGKPPKKITEERYYEMLNVLPPVKWTTIKGVEMFCMSEMLTGVYIAQFAKAGDEYYEKTVDLFDKSTWIYNDLVR